MELIFNIWFIVDIGTDLCGYAIAKPYAVAGTDEEKTEVLRKLSETDYITSERIEIPKSTKIVSGDGSTLEGQIHASMINSFFDANMEYFVRKIEEQLPPVFKFSGTLTGENKALKQEFPASPLFVQTTLVENEFGEMRPLTSKENKEWYENERKRIDNKLKGMCN